MSRALVDAGSIRPWFLRCSSSYFHRAGCGPFHSVIPRALRLAPDWRKSGVKYDLPEPTLEPLDGWARFTTVVDPSLMPSFVSGEPNGQRLRVRYFRRVDDSALVGKAWFGPGTEGPPRHAHGGSIAALLDEAMGFAAWSAGHAVLAARVSIDFRDMLPIGTEALFEASVESVNGRKVVTRSRLYGPRDVDFATAEGLFLMLDAEKLGGKSTGALPSTEGDDQSE